jgi:hypothetical protein
MGFHYGIEHEVAFLNPKNKFADFTNTTFIDFDKIVCRLPLFDEDYPMLRIGDAGIKKKRWYIEGFERFKDSEQVVSCLPKGIEIRTPVFDSIENAMVGLSENFHQLKEAANVHGYTPALISYNPYQKEFIPVPPLNDFEIQRRHSSPEKQTANIPMVTYGPDLNFSVDGLPNDQVIDFGKKLTYYSPFMVPFSFSSPFFGGELWEGYSIRTFVRTGRRPAAMVFLGDPGDLLPSDPSLTKIARNNTEAGRIEFKAFDSCGDFSMYGSLLTLIKGLFLDHTLPGRALVPDPQLHQIAAKQAFESDLILDQSRKMLEAVQNALSSSQDFERLDLLFKLLEIRKTPAYIMIEMYRKGLLIEEILARYSYLDQIFSSRVFT